MRAATSIIHHQQAPMLFCLKVDLIVLDWGGYSFATTVVMHHLLLHHRCAPNVNIRVVLHRFVDEFGDKGILLYFVFLLDWEDLFVEGTVDGSDVSLVFNPFLIDVGSKRQFDIFSHNVDIYRVHPCCRWALTSENVALLIACDVAIWRQKTVYLMFYWGHLGYRLRYLLIAQLVID